MTEFETIGAPKAMRGDCRIADRFPMRSFLRVCCLESAGRERMVAAEGLNLSATGIAFLASDALVLSSLIHVELPNSRVSALGRVRNCVRRPEGWRVGVEFEGAFA